MSDFCRSSQPQIINDSTRFLKQCESNERIEELSIVRWNNGIYTKGGIFEYNTCDQKERRPLSWVKIVGPKSRIN